MDKPSGRNGRSQGRGQTRDFPRHRQQLTFWISGDDLVDGDVVVRGVEGLLEAGGGQRQAPIQPVQKKHLIRKR